jgi:hypothetical protein
MSTYKYIYWRQDQNPGPDGQQLADVHLLVGYTDMSLRSYAALADELRKTFPDITDEELICGRVLRSSYCQSFALLTFIARIPKKDYPGWVARKSPDYAY